MSFTGKEEHSISLEDAARLTQRFRNTIHVGEIKGGFFGKEAFLEILEQEGCVGIRYYYGLDENNTKVLVLVGVNENEDDLYDGVLKEASCLCPPRCSTNNHLNS